MSCVLCPRLYPSLAAPLSAVVRAQAASSVSSYKFIRDAGFDANNRCMCMCGCVSMFSPAGIPLPAGRIAPHLGIHVCVCVPAAINVVFGYSSINSTTGAKINNVLVVPIITLLPLPFLRVRDTVVTQCLTGLMLPPPPPPCVCARRSPM